MLLCLERMLLGPFPRIPTHERETKDKLYLVKIVVILKVRTSYLPSEILWGYRFEHKCVAYDKALNKYAVSYTAINSFLPDRTPRYVMEGLKKREKVWNFP